MARTKYWVWLSGFNIGSAVKRRLLDVFGDPEKVFFADRSELAAARLTERELALLGDKSMERASQILSDCDSRGIAIYTLQDADYPERLRRIPDPPAVLYVRGKLPPVDDLACVAVVGTRRTSPYGARMAQRIGAEIAGAGGVVVSGFAAGVDSAAMEGALNGRPALAVSLGHQREDTYDKAAALAVKVFDGLQAQPLPPFSVLNLNYPERDEALGLKATSLRTLRYLDDYEPEVGEDGETRYTLVGGLDKSMADGEDDYTWLKRGYATMTVLTYDLTHDAATKALEGRI